MPTPTPARVLGGGAGRLPMTQTSTPLQGTPLRSVAYTPERDLEFKAPFCLLCTLPAPAHLLGGRWEAAAFQPVPVGMESGCFGQLLGGPITSHHPPCPLWVFSAVGLTSRTVQAQVHQVLLNAA